MMHWHRGLPGEVMNGKPPTPPNSTRAGPGARVAGCPLGSWHACHKAASSWPPDSAGGPRGSPLISLQSCPGFHLCRLCLPGQPVSPRLLSCLQFIPKRLAVGQEEPRWGRHPLGALYLEPGKPETWTPGDARSPQHPRGAGGEDETAASIVSACQARHENWGGCWRKGRRPAGLCRERGTLVVWFQPPQPPTHYPLPPHPTPRLWWATCWVPGLQ